MKDEKINFAIGFEISWFKMKEKNNFHFTDISAEFRMQQRKK